jgi:hypothetical protein
MIAGSIEKVSELTPDHRVLSSLSRSGYLLLGVCEVTNIVLTGTGRGRYDRCVPPMLRHPVCEKSARFLSQTAI